MPMISINVQNNSTTSKDFLYFMGPVNSSDAGQIYVTSLGTANLGAYVQCGTIITFQLDFQYQAGVQQAHSLPIAGQQSGFYSASQPISLSTSTGSSPDTTTMTVNPFGLTAPVAGPSVPAGTFRISTPAYDSSVSIYNAGTALRTKAGGVVLPSFLIATPNSNIDIQPAMNFYVAAGKAGTGTVINQKDYTNTGACDATNYKSFLVIYNSNGTFSVAGFPDDGMTLSFVKGMNQITSGVNRIFVPL